MRVKLALTVLGTLLSFSIAAQPRLNAHSAVVLDTLGNSLLEKNADEVRPIASISKLLVGSIMITKLPSADAAALYGLDTITINGSERDLMFGMRPKHDRKVKRGSAYTPEELLHISLISSNNIATAALALQLGLDDVIYETNQRARQLGLFTVNITEPTGLSRANVASARDLAAFGMSVAYTDLARISTTPQYTIGKTTYNSTNVFTRLEGWNPLVQKTGFTNPAGRCMLLVIEVQNQVYSIVLLGAATQQAIWQDMVAIRKFLGDSGFTEPKIGGKVNKRKGG